MPALVCDLNCDPEPIFASAGFNSTQFTDPDFEISFVSGSKLLSRCITATGCDHLGLLLGERAHPSSLGVAGFLLQTAPSVGIALQDLVHHLDLHDRGAVVTVVTNDYRTLLEYAIHLPGVEATNQIYDLSMTVACNIMRGLCGAHWNPTEVLFLQRPPQNLAPYKRLFRAPLRFNAGQCALAFQNRWLDHPLKSADSLLHRHLEKEANELHSMQQGNLVADLRLLLRKSLSTQKNAVTEIAEKLGMHERTLNRRLREEGTSFRRELGEVRYELAQQLLTDNRILLSNIAGALGYADTTAFSRAFKQWSGITPTEWRARNQQ
ncbi:MAG: AraC family transcriptional regulator [Gammaproteobacteria bacterium]|nr:AraC family transcriptional regulator [Gammaproteobacteria bacterium]